MATLISFSTTLPDGLASVDVNSGALSNPIALTNVNPSDATYTLTYASSNDTIATVDASGIITPLALGSVTITTTDTDSGVTSDLTFDVVPTDITLDPPTVAITFAGDNHTGTATLPTAPTHLAYALDIGSGLSNGDTITLTVTADSQYTVNGKNSITQTFTVEGLTPVITSFDLTVNSTNNRLYINDSYQLTLTNVLEAGADTTSVTFSSANGNVTIDAAGVITTVTEGDDVITATVGSVSATLAVTVGTDIAFADTDAMVAYTGKSGMATLTATTSIANVTLTASPNSALSNGDTVTITVTPTQGDLVNGQPVYTFTETVSGLVEPVTAFDLTVDKTDLAYDETVQLSLANLTPAGVYTDNVVYTSSNDTVLTVDSTGLVKGFGYGTANINAIVDNVVRTLAFNVVRPTLTDFTVTLGNGGQLVLNQSVTLSVSGALPTNAELGTLTYTASGGVGIQKVSNAEVTIYPYAITGSGTITVTDSASGVSKSVSFTVSKPVVTDFSAEVNTSELLPGMTTKVVLSNVLPAGANTANVLYSSNSTGVATVDNNGVITAVGKGLALISVIIDGIVKLVTIDVFNVIFLRNMPLTYAAKVGQRATFKVATLNVPEPSMVLQSSADGVTYTDIDGSANGYSFIVREQDFQYYRYRINTDYSNPCQLKVNTGTLDNFTVSASTLTLTLGMVEDINIENLNPTNVVAPMTLESGDDTIATAVTTGDTSFRITANGIGRTSINVTMGGISRTVSVTVSNLLAMPTIIEDLPVLDSVMVGDTVTLNAVFSGNPSPKTYLIRTKLDQSVEAPVEVTLPYTFTATKDLNGATYAIKASNTQGGVVTTTQTLTIATNTLTSFGLTSIKELDIRTPNKLVTINVVNMLPAGAAVGALTWTASDPGVVFQTPRRAHSGEFYLNSNLVAREGQNIVITATDVNTGLSASVNFTIKSKATYLEIKTDSPTIRVGELVQASVSMVLPSGTDTTGVTWSVDSTAFSINSRGVISVADPSTPVGSGTIVTGTVDGVSGKVYLVLTDLSTSTGVIETGSGTAIVMATQYDVTDSGVRYPIAKATVGGQLVDTDSKPIYGFTHVSANEWKRDVPGEIHARIQTNGGEYAYPQYLQDASFIGMKAYNGDLMNLESDAILGFVKDDKGLYKADTSVGAVGVRIPQYDADTGKFFAYGNGKGTLVDFNGKDIASQYTEASASYWVPNGLRKQYLAGYGQTIWVGTASIGGNLLDNRRRPIYGFTRTVNQADCIWMRSVDNETIGTIVGTQGDVAFPQYDKSLTFIGYATVDGVLRDAKWNEIIKYEKEDDGLWEVDLQLRYSDIRIPQYADQSLIGYLNGNGVLVTLNGRLIYDYAKQSDGTWSKITPPQPAATVLVANRLKAAGDGVINLPDNYLDDIINQAPSESKMSFEKIKTYVTVMTPGSDATVEQRKQQQITLYRTYMALIRDEESDDVAKENVLGIVDIIRANMGQNECFNFRYAGMYVGELSLTPRERVEMATLQYTLRELAQHGAKLNCDWSAFAQSFDVRVRDKITSRIMGAFNITQ